MERLIECDDLQFTDMSPEAIDERLREVGRLYKLGMALRNPMWIWRGNIIEAESAARQNASLGSTTNKPAPL